MAGREIPGVNRTRACLAILIAAALSAAVLLIVTNSTRATEAPVVAVTPAPLAGPSPVAAPVALSPTSSVAAPTTKRPTTTTRKKPRYTCEPSATAKVDPDTGIITNKSCSDLNAKKERAQREYAEQRQSSARESGREQRDANGETYAEYCTRTGQSVNSCNAG